MEKLLLMLKKDGNCLSGNYEVLTSRLSLEPDKKNLIVFSNSKEKSGEITISGEKIGILTHNPIVYDVKLEGITLFLSPKNQKTGEFTAGANDLASLYK